MSRLPLLLIVALGACGGGDAPAADDGEPDAADDAPIIDASPGCALEPSVARSAFEADSVAYLRAAFETESGFEAGTVAYREGWVSLGEGCATADWSALVYVAPIAPTLVPLELRGSVFHVAVAWSLNGRKVISFIEESASEPAPWIEGRLPDNVNAVAKAGDNAAAIEGLATTLQMEHPELAVEWLDGIGVLTVAGPVGNIGDEPISTTAAEVERAAAKVRTSGLFETLEWSGLNFRIPSAFYPGREVVDEVLRPECMREETSALLPAFTTSPSLAPPLGPGPKTKPPVCPE